MAQCHEWLNKHLPHAERQAVVSNAEATRLASVEQGVASIASLRAAELFEMAALANNIEDDPKKYHAFFWCWQTMMWHRRAKIKPL